MIFAFVAFSALAQTADIQYSGQVVNVDLAAHQVVVKDPQSGGRIRFTMIETTASTSGTDKKSLGDLRPALMPSISDMSSRVTSTSPIP